MNLQTRKYRFIEKLIDIEEHLFSKLETILDRADEVPKRISLEQYNKEIDDAIADIEKGEFFTQEEARKIAGKW